VFYYNIYCDRPIREDHRGNCNLSPFLERLQDRSGSGLQDYVTQTQT